MNIYKVSRRDRVGYDEYDSFVCYAKDEESAERMLPHPVTYSPGSEDYISYVSSFWTIRPADISVEYVGMCLDVEEESVILASYNAG